MSIPSYMEARHSVRQYLDRPIEPEKAALLKKEVEAASSESGLGLFLLIDEAGAFRADTPRYGRFEACRNYFALFGKPGEDEKIGYYGERLVLFAQSIGLNTCWAAVTFEKDRIAVDAPEGMVLFDLIALGYGANAGVPHKDRPVGELAKIRGDSPEWFRKGVEAALLAPTARNQQKFYLEQTGPDSVKAIALEGEFAETDLGIVKYHFEIGAGRKIRWEP